MIWACRPLGFSLTAIAQPKARSLFVARIRTGDQAQIESPVAKLRERIEKGTHGKSESAPIEFLLAGSGETDRRVVRRPRGRDNLEAGG